MEEGKLVPLAIRAWTAFGTMDEHGFSAEFLYNDLDEVFEAMPTVALATGKYRHRHLIENLVSCVRNRCTARVVATPPPAGGGSHSDVVCELKPDDKSCSLLGGIGFASFVQAVDILDGRPAPGTKGSTELPTHEL